MIDDQEAGLVTCGACASLVLPRNHCSVCGEALLVVEGTRRYAADRAEPVRAIRLATTLFPRLPHADLEAFRLALAAGVLVVVALAAAGFLPVALLVSALMVPLLLTVYLYSTDVYEDEPIRVILVTLAWGAVTGGLFGLLLRELYPARVIPPADETLEILSRVVILPSIAMGLVVAGPLVLLRYRKFDDVLDGATFGAVSGSMFVGAQVIAQSIDLLSAGAQPGGDTWSWVLRILEHAVLVPLIVGGAAAGACGAFWLRYRAPVRDRSRLGPLGRPALATLAACLASVMASASLVLLRDLPRLAVLGGLTVLALAWLRHLLDLGLREEAVEAATGEEQECQGCHRLTPAGSFCTWCGVGLRALPKRAGQGPAPRHGQPSRLPGARSLVVFGVGMVIILAGAVLLVQLLTPVVRPPCPDPTQPCPATLAAVPAPAGPVLGQAGSSVIRFGQTQTMDGGDWQLDFDPRWWFLDTTEPGAVWLSTTWVATTVRGDSAEIPISLRLEVVPVAVATREQMMERLSTLVTGTLESTTERDEHGTRLLRPHIGFQPADSRYLVGDFGEAGALTPFGAHLLAASDGRQTAGVVLYVGQPDESFPFFSGSVRTTRIVGDLLDDLLKRFYWSGDDPVGAQAADLRETGARGLLPEEIRRAYGIDELHAMGLRGQGQVVAIMSFDTFLDADLAAWDRETGTVGPPVERLLVAGPVPLGGGSGEVNLDIQMIRAIAPEATIIDVEAPLGASYADVVEAIIADGRADIASLSWGHCEAIGDAFPEHRAWFEDLVSSEDAVFERAFDADLTIFAIPGDEGVYGCVRSAPEAFHDLLAVWYPGSHPLVVSVGGTYEWRQQDGTYDHEATWAGPMSGEATGGGASRFFPMPDWQRALGLETRSAMRLSPDVAGPGDPDSGLLVISTPVVLQDGAWQAASDCGDGSPPPCFSFGGGTSQSAPFWAGLAALIRQGAEEQGLLPVIGGRPRMPHLLPLLYRVAAERPEAFHDVTMGSNLLEDAGVGWDPATGLGTPNAPILAHAIWDLLRDAAPE